MPIAQDRFRSGYEEGSEWCAVEDPAFENRTWWEEPKSKYEALGEWFLVRGSHPQSIHWLGSKPRRPKRKFLRPVETREVTSVRDSIPATISEEIESSKWILDLQQDWDENDSPPYSEQTWRRACDFLIQQAAFARQTLGKELPAPQILPGPNASIDLRWKDSRFELLLNIPADSSKSATFYGDDYGNLCIRGNLDPSEPIPGLIIWLLW